MKVLITGGAGLLAHALKIAFSDSKHLLILSKKELDITDLSAFLSIVKEFRPNLILNTAAFTRVDDGELFPDLCFQVNTIGARNAAVAAQEVEASLAHFSTDFIFDGRKQEPYREWDPPNPLSVYGKSKLAGEEMIRQIYGRHYIVRTSWLFGENGNNFVSIIRQRLLERSESLNVVIDQFGSPTYTKDLALAVKFLVQTPAYGTYHLSNSNYCSRFELALEIARISGLNENLVAPVTSKEYHLPAIRPANSILENYHWQLMGFAPLRDYRLALKEYLKAWNNRDIP